jgi:hypothetical protein
MRFQKIRKLCSTQDKEDLGTQAPRINRLTSPVSASVLFSVLSIVITRGSECTVIQHYPPWAEVASTVST